MKKIETCPVCGKTLRFRKTRFLRIQQEVCDSCDIKFDYGFEDKVFIESTKGSRNLGIYWDSKYHPFEDILTHISNVLNKNEGQDREYTINIDNSSENENTKPIRNTPENISEKKLVFTNIQADEISSRGKIKYNHNSKEVFIEELAMDYYKSRGMDALWTENHYWWFMYGLLFWDIIFMKSEHCMNIPLDHPDFDYNYNMLKDNFIDMPYDFFRDTFYTDRIDAINSRFEELRSSDISEEIKKSYNSHYNKRCRAIEDWGKYSLDELLIAPTHLHNEQLLSIMERLIKDFSENRSGLPDLLVYTDKELFLVEVKSRNDTLSNRQVEWHEYILTNSKINVVIFTVNKTEKQIISLKKKYDKEHIIEEKKKNNTSTNVTTNKSSEIDELKKEYERNITKSKLTTEEKYTLVLYLNQIKKKPTYTRLMQSNIIGESTDSIKIEEHAFKKGYLKEPEDNDKFNTVVNCYTIPELKEVLRKHKLKGSGRKQELIDRLRDNVSMDELNKEFTKKSYTVTDKGQILLNNNPQVNFYGTHFRHHPLRQYEKFYQKNKNKGNVKEVAIKYLEHIGKENISKCKWFCYRWQSVREIAYIYYENKEYNKALPYFIELFICEINGWDDNFNSIDYGNPINERYVTELINTVNTLRLDINNIESLFNECCDNTKIPLIIIPRKDMFKYFLELVNDEDSDKVNREVTKRINVPNELEFNLYFNNKKEEKEVVNRIKQYTVFK